MSYKITNAKFLNQKILVKNFDFSTEKNTITQVHFQNNHQKKLFTRILKGKEQIGEGRFLVDGLDLVNPKFVKNHATFIHTDKYIERFIPAKIILVLSSLFNPKFVRDARIKHLRTKYDYLSFLSSKLNLTDAQLKGKLDKAISDFINNETKIEERVLGEFEQQMHKFNQQQSNEIFSKLNSVVKVVARSYYKEKIKLVTYNLTLTFFQALYDDVYKFNSLRNSCTCEYNAKKSSNKEVRKVWKELSYQQTKYVVKKQLKYIGIKISENRTLITRQNLLVNQLKKQLNLELKKFYFREKFSREQVTSFNKTLNNWRRVIDDQVDIFTRAQQDYFFKTLMKNSQYVVKVLVVKIHHYHQLVLSNSLKYRSKEDFKKNKVYYKKQIVSVFKQALDYNTKLMKKFNINLDWFLKSTFKLSSLNILFVKIIRAINMNRDNIFLMDLVHLLSQNDFEKLLATIKLMKETNAKMTFTMLESKTGKLPFLDQKIYTLNDGYFEDALLTKLIDVYPETYRFDLFGTRNLFRYEYENQHIKLYNKREPYSQDNLPAKGYAFINPFKMNYETTTNFAKNKIAVISDFKRTNNFNDPHMYYCKNKKGYKFYFYDYDHNDLNKVHRGIVTFDLSAIAEFIEIK